MMFDGTSEVFDSLNSNKLLSIDKPLQKKVIDQNQIKSLRSSEVGSSSVQSPIPDEDAEELRISEECSMKTAP